MHSASSQKQIFSFAVSVITLHTADPCSPSIRKCLFRNSPCNCLCRQIKNLFSQPFSYCFHRRKQSCHRFSDSGRRLDKQLLFSQDRAVYRGCQVTLSFPDRKTEIQSDRIEALPTIPPLNLQILPIFHNCCHQILQTSVLNALEMSYS